MKSIPSRRRQHWLLTLLILFLLQTARATTVTVHVGAGGGLTFSPDPVVIQPGDTVEWTWDFSGHSVTSGAPGAPTGLFDSGVQAVPFTFSHTFPTAGTVPYFCTRHGAMMTGTVNVVVPSTPTPTPSTTPDPSPTPINISGTISYCSNPSLPPLAGVTLLLSGDASAMTVTDGSGNYQFSSVAPGGNYDVTPSRAALLPGSPGITTVDVVAVQRHFLSIALLPPGCRLTAADVNLDASVSTSDVIAIQRFALAQASGFAQAGKYQFNPAFRTYSPLTTGQTGQDYDALVYGDVAATYVHRPEGEPETEE